VVGLLNSRQIDLVLRSEIVGHLGCYASGEIYVAPISYVYDGESIYGHSADGVMLRMMRQSTGALSGRPHRESGQLGQRDRVRRV
jgi:nitroimidazol reductase NimA-like FMN-containing flavoprotein (pyridoxamine 5'-phosphate oxidase superfamily)